MGTGAPVVQFRLPRPAQVTLVLYDITGRRLATLLDGRRAAGLHTEQLGAAGTAARGVYLCRLSADGERRDIKFLLLP
jgi:hypothetical protein